MIMPEDFSEYLRKEELRRANADSAAHDTEATEQRARAQADAQRLAAEQEEARLRAILAEDAARVAIIAAGNVPENVVRRRGILTRPIGWIVGTKVNHIDLTESDYDFTPNDIHTRVATLLLKNGELKVTDSYEGPDDPRQVTAHEPVRVRGNDLADPSRMLQEDFDRYRGYLAWFALSNELNMQ